MARTLIKTDAIVLRTMRMGETSKLATLFTEHHGKLKVTAKGARRPKSKFAGCLEMSWQVHITCPVRDDRDLHTLTDAETVTARPELLADLRRLSYAAAACEMVDRLSLDHVPNSRLYLCLKGVLTGIEEVATEQLETLFWYFQLRVAEALGYRPELANCANCGTPLPAESAWFSPALGGGVCRDCGRQATDESEGQGAPEYLRARRISADSLRLLNVLQGLRTYTREAIPAVVPARQNEVRGLLRSFLEYHGGTSGRLRSLEFLDAMGVGA
ncbi:MAG: DNA repair protein RecO [Candidatus Latescibacteria bacterium]|jgi:DNA repair protein RecO (recombination protein O)|nr:DNA repair protein RecO [Gemmatimonadaceae bacterium]MDP7448704.1 DNA repair protein RecO [Candidatus Latescibacterota bacterium]HJP33937.1 DNA repair protein RecO [Candidatus Latescibacterota bacterium]|tara:strand:+ start:511 stop:1326 length:816 start_codon:yes stop_codon:yes gene_type:complete